MSNPGPNIVQPSLQRGAAVISVASPSATAAKNTVTEATVTVSGVAVGDWVSVNPTKSPGTGVAIGSAYVSAANTITIEYVNATGTDQSVASDTYLINVIRSYPVQTDFGVTKFNNYGVVAGSNP